MNLKLMVWALAGVGVLVASPAWTTDLKIAVVDFGRLLEDSPQYKVAQESLRTEFTPRQRELQNQQNSLKAKEDKLQKDGATMTPDQRATVEKELRDSYRELQRKQSEVQDDLTARRNEEMSRLQKTVIEQVRTYAKSQNFDLVLADGVIYTTPTIDITSQVLQALQSHGAAKPAATAPAPGPVKPQSH